MRNFRRLATGIEVNQALLELDHHKELWSVNDARTNFDGSPFLGTGDIWLRMSGSEAGDRREAVNLEPFYQLHAVRGMINSVMASVGCERLGRCMVTRVPPGGEIKPHTDIGDDLSIYYDNESYYSRFHLVLQGLPGSIFNSGDETVTMKSGELWWFDNSIEHSVINNSADDRIHLVIDIKVLK